MVEKEDISPEKTKKKHSSHATLSEDMEELQDILESIEYSHKWTNFWLLVLVVML